MHLIWYLIILEKGDTPGNNPEKDPNYTIIIVVSSVVGFIVIVAVLFLVIKYRNKFPCCHKIDSNDIISSNNKEQDKFLEWLNFDLKKIYLFSYG